MSAITIKRDDLSGPEIASLLQRHLDHMHAITPAGSVFALDIDALRGPEITFWSAWLEGELVGCVALKEHGDGLGEIKSMHTVEKHRGKRIGYKMVEQLIAEARERGLERLSLETGKTGHFIPAQRLYERFGFKEAGPFAAYKPDPHSYFMTLSLV